MSIEIVESNPDWSSEFAVLASRLGSAPNEPLAIDHIGSTAVSGLPAKDVIDAQVIVATLDARESILAGLAAIGFRQRPGGWNLRDHVPPTWKGDPSAWDKLVVGPPDGERPANVHVRAAGSPGERYALLFRDFLRADRVARDAWASYKLRLAALATNLETYGQVKDPATDVLLLAAKPGRMRPAGRSHTLTSDVSALNVQPACRSEAPHGPSSLGCSGGRPKSAPAPTELEKV